MTLIHPLPSGGKRPAMPKAKKAAKPSKRPRTSGTRSHRDKLIPAAPEILAAWEAISRWRRSIVETIQENESLTGPAWERMRTRALREAAEVMGRPLTSSESEALEQLAARVMQDSADDRAQLADLDRDIRDARTPAKVLKLAGALREWRIQSAHTALRGYLERRRSPAASLFLRSAQAALGELMEPPTDGNDLDIEALREDAEAWRAAKNRKHADVARRIVASVTPGLTVDSRILRKQPK